VNGVPVARILGFEVRLHVSWIFIVAIVTVTVAGRITTYQPTIDPLIAWGVGLFGSLGFMVTVIGHELAHAVFARRDGAAGDVVIVHFIGSPAAIDVIARSAKAEAQIAAAGPIVSALTGLAVCVVAYGLLLFGPALGAIGDVLVIIGALDLILAAVSVVPAFPLDGGRIVRAIGWAWTKDMRKGTRISGVVGKWVGRALLVFGFAILLAEAQLGGDLIDGLMIALVGWFLMASSKSVDRWLVLDELVQGVRVGDAMEQQLETVTPQLTLDTFAESILDGSVGPALPVVSDEAVVGIVGAAQVRAVPKKRWAATRASEVMIGGATLPSATPDEQLTTALDRMRTWRLDGLPVLDGATLRGVVTRRSIAAILHARADARGMSL
jgi:Zn-dependent protease/predicted transcriptional regulator